MDHCYVQLYSMNDVIHVYQEDVRPSNENAIRIIENSIAHQEEVGPSNKNVICTSNNSIARQEDVRSLNENVKNKDDDDYLVELYREQRCLYDANHWNFKNKQMKEKAWREIAAKMQQKNKHYSPKYCKMRCTSLRDQYSRGRRNIEKCKGGNANRKLEFFSQLSFLDKFIKRRRTFRKKKMFVQPVQHVNSNLHNHYKSESNDASNDSIAIGSSDEFENAMDIPQEKYIDASTSTSQDQKILIKQNSNNCSKNIKTSKCIEHEIDQSTSIDKISANIIKLTNLLENLKENVNEVKTPDQVFAEYICTVLKLMSEPEKSERKKLIIDALSKSLHNM